jgi:hypothetical protein
MIKKPNGKKLNLDTQAWSQFVLIWAQNGFGLPHI